MQIVLYKNSAEANRVDKIPFLTYVNVLEGSIKDATDVTNCIIEIQYEKFIDFNYVYIVDFKRYYYIDSFVISNKNIYHISCVEDVLMSYKDSIYRVNGFIDRNEFDYNDVIPDSKRVNELGVDFEIAEITNNLFVTNDLNTDNTYKCSFIVNGYYLDWRQYD